MAVATEITPYYRLEAFAFDLYQRHYARMGLARASDAGARLLQIIGPFSSAQKTAQRNLRMAYPNESESWRAEVLKGVWAEIGRTAAEMPHTHEFTSRGDKANIEIGGREHFEAAKETGAVFIAGHFSNWEAVGVGIVEIGLTCHFTYRPANNPLIDQRILATRERYGIRMQAAKGIEGGIAIARALKAKETIAVMNDQKYNEGLAAPMFGYECMTADGPTRLALRYRRPLIPLSLRRLGGARFRLTAHPPMPLNYDAPVAEEVAASVARINAWTEARVREAPEQWFWVHRRWPKEAWAKAGVL